jgi:hypothetical protein
MLPVPLPTVLHCPHVGGNHSPDTVETWETKMIAYKKGVDVIQEDDCVDDDIMPITIPGHTITPSLSHLVLSDDDLRTLRLRFLLDRSLKNLMVLVGIRYTLNEKQLLTVTILLKRVMDTPSGEGVGYSP